MANPKFFNPVTGQHRGVVVRKYNVIQMRVNEKEFKQFIDAKIDRGLSAREFIERGGIFCNCSGPLVIQKVSYEKSH